MANPGAKDDMGMYIALKEQRRVGSWRSESLRLERRDAFLFAYEADPTGDVLHPRVVVHCTGTKDRSEWLHEARAIDLTREIFRRRVIGL